MAEEGELKKRIREAQTVKVLKDNIDITIDNPQTTQSLRAIDEAKKDIYEPINRLELQGEDTNGMDYAYTYQKLVERIKKWFGDST